MIFKTKTPKRLCYYWQQYILFREGSPSSYLSTENLVEKPLKTSSYNSNIKNLTIFTTLWAMWNQTVGAILYAAFYILEIAAAFLSESIKRTIAEQAVKVLFIIRFMARKKLTFSMLKKLEILAHENTS